jgi:hypothetical protein
MLSANPRLLSCSTYQARYESGELTVDEVNYLNSLITHVQALEVEAVAKGSLSQGGSPWQSIFCMFPPPQDLNQNSDDYYYSPHGGYSEQPNDMYHTDGGMPGGYENYGQQQSFGYDGQNMMQYDGNGGYGYAQAPHSFSNNGAYLNDQSPLDERGVNPSVAHNIHFEPFGQTDKEVLSLQHLQPHEQYHQTYSAPQLLLSPADTQFVSPLLQRPPMQPSQALLKPKGEQMQNGEVFKKDNLRAYSITSEADNIELNDVILSPVEDLKTRILTNSNRQIVVEGPAFSARTLDSSRTDNYPSSRINSSLDSADAETPGVSGSAFAPHDEILKNVIPKKASNVVELVIANLSSSGLGLVLGLFPEAFCQGRPVSRLIIQQIRKLRGGKDSPCKDRLMVGDVIFMVNCKCFTSTDAMSSALMSGKSHLVITVLRPM